MSVAHPARHRKRNTISQKSTLEERDLGVYAPSYRWGTSDFVSHASAQGTGVGLL